MNLDVKNLNKSFPIMFGPLFQTKGKVQAVRQVSFSVAEGKSLGIVGESGSGKTTIAKILAGFLPADSGSAEFNACELLRLPRRERSKLVQMIFQDPFASLNPKLILQAQIFEALRIRGIREPLEPARELLEDVGLSEDYLWRYPHQLSGGQRQRFAIARALAAEPKLLLADEPVSSLDLSVQAQIINLLNALREKKRFTQIVISHDLAVIANTCEEVIVMKDGAVIEAGPTEKILSAPEDPYTRRLLSATPVIS